MKMINFQCAVTLLLIAIFISCKKTEDVIIPTSSLSIHNCLSDGTPLFVKFFNSQNVSFANKTNGIAAPFGVIQVSSMERGLPSGHVPLKLYAFPDSLNVLTSADYDLKAKGIYSLFVSGTKTAADTLFTKDEIPFVAPVDSLVLIRFIHLAKSTGSVSINLVGKQANPLTQQMQYKSASDFQSFSVKRADFNSNSFTFEVRDSQSQILLTTFTYAWNMPGAQGGGTHFMSKAATAVLLNSGNTIKTLVIKPTLAF